MSSLEDYSADSTNDSSFFGISTTTTTQERSQCTTEEVEPGKFVRKCARTKKVVVSRGFGSWFKLFETVESTTQHTEEDVTDHARGGSARPNQLKKT